MKTERARISIIFAGLCTGDIIATWFQHDGWHQIPLIVVIFLFAFMIGAYLQDD